jgi:uncharacterized membrane protein
MQLLKLQTLDYQLELKWNEEKELMDVKLKAIDCLINYHYHFLLLTLCVGIFTLLCWILSILFILFFVCNILVSVRHIECSIICAKHINNS